MKGELTLDYWYKVDKDDKDTMKMVGNFVWRKVSPATAQVLMTETDIDVYLLHDDGSESLIDQEGYDALDWDNITEELGIEVGHVELDIGFSPVRDEEDGHMNIKITE